MRREYFLPQLRRPKPVGNRCYGIDGDQILLVAGPTSLLVAGTAMAPAVECPLPAPMVGPPHIYRDSLVTFVSRKREQRSKKVTEETWYAFDFRSQAVAKALHLQPTVPALDHFWATNGFVRAYTSDLCSSDFRLTERYSPLWSASRLPT